jgi:hypothetical protein
MLRALNNVLSMVNPAAGGVSGGGAAGGPVFGMAPPPSAAGAAAAGGKGALPGGYNPVAGFAALGFGGRWAGKKGGCADLGAWKGGG